MNVQIKTYNYEFAQIRTYFIATLFVIGNLLLPQLCHLIPRGGEMFIPIYFFTLIAAFRYGPVVGLITAVLSPIANNLLFGMPAAPMLNFVLTKSVILAISAFFATRYFKTLNPFVILAVVLCYQIVGGAVQFIFTQNFSMILSMFALAIPGMLIQIIGGYLVIKALNTFK